MSEEHFDEFEHYNFDQDKAMRSGHSGESQWKDYLEEKKHDCVLVTYEIEVCLVTISLHVMRMMHSTAMLRKAANKEGGIDEHKQTQSWRPREEDSDEVDERWEEQYE